jgi:CRISPR-associated protein Cas1
MKKLLNTLYVQSQGAYLRLDHETLVMELEGKVARQMPLHPLASIAVFGNIMMSPQLIAKCAEEGRSIVFFDSRGRFQFSIQGPVSGNVLLRCSQHGALAKPESALAIARNMVAGKLQNARQVLARGARDAPDDKCQAILQRSVEEHAESIKRLAEAKNLDTVRGIEGMAGASYFDAFGALIRVDDPTFEFRGRTRRPPRDPVNALLSFLYALLRAECSSALEGVGLDPQVGYLHSVRPGRPALALDLMEELRPVLADRLALTLINRRQLSKKEFDKRTGGAVHLNEDGRRTVILAWQERKQDEVHHPTVDKKVAFGLVPHVQARLLARHLRGDIEAYPPFLWR